MKIWGLEGWKRADRGSQKNQQKKKRDLRTYPITRFPLDFEKRLESSSPLVDKSYRSTSAWPRFKEFPAICFLSMVCACMMQCKLGGPGTLSHFPHCLLPPIMCCRFYVYEGCALIACMCMQCKEARDFCLMPPPTEHAIAHRTYFCGNHDSVQENKNTKRNFVWIPQLELTNRSLGLRQCTALSSGYTCACNDLPESKKQLTMTTQPSAQRPIVLKRKS